MAIDEWNDDDGLADWLLDVEFMTDEQRAGLVDGPLGFRIRCSSCGRVVDLRTGESIIQTAGGWRCPTCPVPALKVREPAPDPVALFPADRVGETWEPFRASSA
jgi:DNA-directed RNA polymerase subunit RPC12/RpoP